MKICFFFLLLLCSFSAIAKTDILQFNHDVFHCSNEYKFLFEIEKSSGVYQVDAEGIEIANSDFQQSLESTVNQLGAFSPARAQFLRELAAPNNPKIQYRKKIRIARSSPPSNIILPEDCVVEAISTITFDKNRNYTIVINKDIYDALSTEGKISYFFILSLDIQQIFTERYWYEINDLEINLVQSREFLACWYNKSCRPKTLAGFHAFSQKEIYNLKFFEQDHFLLPINDPKTILNSQTGLIESAEYPIMDLVPSTTAFRPYFIFRNEKISFSSSLSTSRVFFDERGRLNCVPVLHNVRIDAINGGSPVSLFGTCWNNDKEDDILTTEFFHGLNTEGLSYVANIDNQKVSILDISTVKMYEDEKLNWISNARGIFKFNNQEVLLYGLLKLYPSGKLQCLQLGKDTTLKLPNGQQLRMPLDSRWSNSTILYCFTEDGNFLKSYNISYYDAIRIIF